VSFKVVRDELRGGHGPDDGTRASNAQAPSHARCTQLCGIDESGQRVDPGLTSHDRRAGEENHGARGGNREIRSTDTCNHDGAQKK
jgi:hypothetical protein